METVGTCCVFALIAVAALCIKTVAADLLRRPRHEQPKEQMKWSRHSDYLTEWRWR